MTDVSGTAQSFTEQVTASRGLGLASYMPVPVTSGLNEIRLMQRAGTKDRVELRRAPAYNSLVFQANLRAGAEQAARLRNQLPGRLIINPGAFDQAGWTQEQYIDYWLHTIQGQCADLRLNPVGLMSSGVRTEVSCALMASIPIFDLAGQPLDAVDIQHYDDRLRLVVCRGTDWLVDDIDRYAPPVDFQALSRQPYEAARDARESFARFVTKHNEQIKSETSTP